MFKKLLFYGGVIVSTGLSIKIYATDSEKIFLKTALAATHNPFTKTQNWDFNWDNQHNENRSKAIKHLILIRHGQYVYEENDKNCVLTILGREQASYTGKFLKNLGINYDKLIYSTMTRATETAEIIINQLGQKHLSITSNSDLEEGQPYPPEPPVPHWPMKPDWRDSDNARIERAFTQYFVRASSDQTKDSYDVIVCHANVIRYFLCRALQFPPESWIRFSLDNASITWISIHPTGLVTVRTIGNSGFMPVHAVTTG